MHPYTCAAAAGAEDPGDSGYELTGVVVHMGTADSGHYYALCRRGADEWFEFNDSVVRPFDMSRLDEETFGGSQPAPGGAVGTGKQGVTQPQGGRKAKGSLKIKNAFMLVYSRVGTAASTAATAADTPVDASLRQAVHAGNLRFWKNKSVYTEEHYDFCTRLLLQPLLADEASPLLEPLFDATVRVFFVVLVQAEEKDTLRVWAMGLSSLVRRRPAWAARVLSAALQPGAPEDGGEVLATLLVRELSHAAVMRVLCAAVESAGALDVTDALHEALATLARDLVRGVLRVAAEVLETSGPRTLTGLPFLFQPIHSLAVAFEPCAELLLDEGVLHSLLALLLFDTLSSDEHLAAAVPKDPVVASAQQGGLVAAIATLCDAVQAQERLQPLRESLRPLLSSQALPQCLLLQLRALYGVKCLSRRARVYAQLQSLVSLALHESEAATQVPTQLLPLPWY